MLIDLFVTEYAVCFEDVQKLRSLSVGFGGCPQLTNILKNVEFDSLDGRIFIPAGTARAVVLELAIRATSAAIEYICLLSENDFPADVTALPASAQAFLVE